MRRLPMEDMIELCFEGLARINQAQKREGGVGQG